jgi:hypothetical protein
MDAIDVHQHLWPPALIEALRMRTRPPRLVGWRLELDGEAPYEVDPAAHDVPKRVARENDDGTKLALVALSAALGIDDPNLLEAWHVGALELPAPFKPWAAANVREPDLQALRANLDNGCVGLELPATAIGTPAGVEKVGPLLEICEAADKPVLIHPGPATPPRDDVPAWWPAVVDYVAQLHAAWWSWHVAGRQLFPDLRLCFAAAAGLAPAHHERLAARGGTYRRIDRDVFVDTSSYGPRGLDAVIRVLGIDNVVFGTDRPYAEPTDPGLGAAATVAIRRTNPHRLLEGGLP